jgi:DNA uptake protein ComE-like DNA-binding protein
MPRRCDVDAVPSQRCFFGENSVPTGWKWVLLAAAVVCVAPTVCAGPLGALRGTDQGPEQSSRSGSQNAAKQPAPAPEARVDINHASIDALMKVPGMTETWAARIVRFRPYRTKQDLLDKGVVTSQVYDRIKDYVIAHQLNH